MKIKAYILSMLPSPIRCLFRSIRYRAVSILMGRKINVSLDGMEFQVVHNNIQEFRAARRFLNFEGEFVSRFIDHAEDAEVIYDVGAYIGLYSLAAASSNPIATISAFEPQATNLEAIRGNIAANNFERIQVFPFALGDVRATETVVGSGSTSAMASEKVKEKGVAQEGNVVEVWPLDWVVQWKQLSPPNIVKIDVEGYEAHVLRGMRGILQHDRPIVFLELHPKFLESFGSSAAWIERYMGELDYDSRVIRSPKSHAGGHHKQTHVKYDPL